MITYSSKTYLKDIDKYIYYQYSNKDFSITIKKILDTKPFIINEDGKNIKILDKNYYVMEIIPYSKNYICRIHLDNNKNVIERYFIMSLKNSFKNNIPVFDNLKTAYVCCDFQNKIYNIENLDKLYNDKLISIEELKNIKEELDNIIYEINNGSNNIYNYNYKEIIDDCEEL